MSEEVKKWKKLYSGLVERNRALEKELVEKEKHILVLLNSVEHAQGAVDINKSIMRQSLLDFNAKEQNYIEVISKLRAKLKEMGFADFDNLGN